MTIMMNNINKNSMTYGISIINGHPALKALFRWMINEDEKSNEDGAYPKTNINPYHNLGHMVRVLGKCVEGAVFYDLLGSDANNKYDPIIDLLLAALIHDFKHSAGKYDDSKNVSIAKAAFTKAYNECEEIRNSVVIIDCVEAIIDATQYPYTIDSANLSLKQSIIRDADAMMAISDSWFQDVILGLSAELKISMQKMINGQMNFIQNMEFCSTWANDCYSHYKEKALNDITQLQIAYFGEQNDL